MARLLHSNRCAVVLTRQQSLGPLPSVSVTGVCQFEGEQAYLYGRSKNLARLQKIFLMENNFVKCQK